MLFLLRNVDSHKLRCASEARASLGKCDHPLQAALQHSCTCCSEDFGTQSTKGVSNEREESKTTWQPRGWRHLSGLEQGGGMLHQPLFDARVHALLFADFPMTKESCI